MRPVVERFLQKISVSDNIYQGTACWDWTASKNQSGYGQFIFNKKTIKSHRLSYELYNGEIPKGLVIDHLCRNRSCVNPIHLEAVTHQENCKRGISYNEKKTHCPQGHEYNVSNTYRNTQNNFRSCIICRSIKMKEYNQRPEVIAQKKHYRDKLENKIKLKEYFQRPENRIKAKEYRDRPENIIKQKEYHQKYYQIHKLTWHKK